jgi:hypothetical protein
MGPDAIDAYYRWLYTPRDDGKPRVLILRRFKQSGTRPAILPFIDHTKQVNLSIFWKKTRTNCTIYWISLFESFFYCLRTN